MNVTSVEGSSIALSPPPRRITRTSSRHYQQPPRRSTRQAALDANIRILEAQDRMRRTGRQRQDAVSNKDAEGNKDHPIELLDDVDTTQTENQKMAALPTASEDLMDFTCAICLDCPTDLSDLAAISGCTHRFCFECIDTWAKTENRCPCCKARFRTIDRVQPIPVTTTPTTSSGRRDKRKRGGIGSSRSPRRRTSDASTPVNSRSVEDRNQPSGLTMNVTFIEQVLQQFSNVSAEYGGNAMTGVFQLGGPSFRFSNVGGRPVMRIERGPGVSSIELFLTEREGEDGRPGRGRVRYMRSSEASGGGIAATASAGGNAAAAGNSPSAFGTTLSPVGERRGVFGAAESASPSVRSPSVNATAGAAAGISRTPSRIDRLHEMTRLRATRLEATGNSAAPVIAAASSSRVGETQIRAMRRAAIANLAAPGAAASGSSEGFRRTVTVTLRLPTLSSSVANPSAISLGGDVIAQRPVSRRRTVRFTSNGDASFATMNPARSIRVSPRRSTTRSMESAENNGGSAEEPIELLD